MCNERFDFSVDCGQWVSTETTSYRQMARDVNILKCLLNSEISFTLRRNNCNTVYCIINSAIILLSAVCLIVEKILILLSPKAIFLVFKSSCYLPICISHKMEASHCPFLLLNVKQEALWILIFLVFSLARPGTKIYSTASVADTL